MNLVDFAFSLLSQTNRLWKTDFGDETAAFDVSTSKNDRIPPDNTTKSVKSVAHHISYRLHGGRRSGKEQFKDSHVMAERFSS